MGNLFSSSDGNGRRRHNRRRSNSLPTVTPPPNPPPPPPPPPATPPPPSSEIPTNRIVFAAATPYPNPNPNPNPNPHQLYQYPGYYPPPPGTMPVPLPASYDHHNQHHHHHYPPLPYHHPLPWTTGGRYPYGGPMMPPPPPYVEHQKAVTIRNDVNLKKESLKLEPDLENPGRFLVTFTFDATVSGRITVIFFAKESEECNLTATKAEILPPITMDFEKGLGQKFRQASGSGIDFTKFEDVELFKAADTDIYPLAVKAEAADDEGGLGSKNAQITQAVYEKDKGEIKIRVVKQILWVNGMRYELQEIYGIGNTVDGDDDDADTNDPGKECVICLSEPRDTTVLPCRHMCMCSGCAKVLRFQTNRCPICRQPVERLLEIKVHGNSHNGNNNNGEGASEKE